MHYLFFITSELTEQGSMVAELVLAKDKPEAIALVKQESSFLKDFFEETELPPLHGYLLAEGKPFAYIEQLPGAQIVTDEPGFQQFWPETISIIEESYK